MPPQGKFIRVWRGVGSVDRFAVGFHPFANGEKAIDAGLGHTAVGAWPDVEQVIDAFAGEFNEKLEQCFHAFPVVVIGFVAPGIVEGGGVSPSSLRGDRWGSDCRPSCRNPPRHCPRDR